MSALAVAHLGQNEDTPTEQLLLLSLCNLAVAASRETAAANSVLLQLVGPQLSSAQSSLAGLRSLIEQQHASGGASHAQLSAGAAAAVPLFPDNSMPALQSSSPPALQQQQQQHEAAAVVLGHHMQSAVARIVQCFDTLSALTTGLPTGLPKSATASRRKLQQGLSAGLRQDGGVGKRATATSGQQLNLSILPSLDKSINDKDNASMASASSMGVSESDLPNPITLPAGRQSSSQGSPQPQQSKAAHTSNSDKLVTHHQQQARYVALQLLLQSWGLVQSALQCAAYDYIGQYKQVLLSVCQYLVTCLHPAILIVNLGTGTSSGNAAMQTASGTLHSTSSPATPGHNDHLSPSPHFQLLHHVLQSLESLPGPVLQQSCCLQVLSSCCCCCCGSMSGGPVTASSSWNMTEGLSENGNSCTVSADVNGCHCASGSFTVSAAENLSCHLCAVISKALPAACNSILSQTGGLDPDDVIATLNLASMTLLTTQAALVHPADLDALLALTQLACRSYHLDQCYAVLEWIQVEHAVVYCACVV